MKKIFFMVLFLFASFCFALGKADNKNSSKKNVEVPEWVKDVNSVYDKEHFIAELASDGFKDVAKTKALSAVVSYFKSQVSVASASESVLTEKKAAANSNYTSTRVLETTLNIESDVELYGIKYDYFYNENEKIYYCVAYLNREDTWKMIEGDLDILLKTAKSNFQNAKNNDDIFSQIRLYAKNRAVNEKFNNIYFFARVIDYKKTENYKEIQTITLDSEKQILALSDKGAVMIVNKTSDANSVEKKLREVLEKEGFTVTSGKAAFTANVDCEMESQVQGEYIVSYPKIAIEIFEGPKTVYSFAKTSGRVVGIDEMNLKTKAIRKVEEMLEEMFK